MINVSSYFERAKSLFFKWEDDGTVLTWYDGTTIAFVTELATAIRRTGPECLPPLNAIAMLLAACRESWPHARHLLVAWISGAEPRALNPGSWEATELRLLLRQLDRIHEFPPQLKASLDARCELLAMATQNCASRWSAAEAEWFASQLEAGLPIDARSMESIGDAEKIEVCTALRRLVQDLLWFKEGLDAVAPEDVEQQLRTGLPEPIEAPEPEDVSARELISQLLDDEELGGVARLAKNLMAVVHFPKSLDEQEDLPLGGVSDITNRGQLDRLLLSELAHDDLTLAVRVAMNEAMYLRRESPPRSRPQSRHVLVDSGVCMWGTPRIYATATALAMAATSEANTTVHAWRGDGPERHEIDLTARSGLEEQLHGLSAHLHCADAIGEFLADTCVDGSQTESVIITCDDAAATPEFQRVVREARERQPVFVMTVSRNGALELVQHTARGGKTIRTAHVDLDDVMSARVAKAVRIPERGDLPLIFHQEEFPLRLSCPTVEGGLMDSRHGTISITGDGRLVVWDQYGLGALQLSDQLGRGKVHWVGRNPDGIRMFVHGAFKQNGLQIVWVLPDRTVSIQPVAPSHKPVHVTGADGLVYVCGSTEVESFGPGVVESLGNARIPAGYRRSSSGVVNSAHSRFFTSSDGSWLALSGVEPSFEEVPVPVDACHVFECYGVGPVAILGAVGGDRRELRRSSDGLVCAIASKWFAVCHDGHFLAHGGPGSQNLQLLNVATFESEGPGSYDPQYTVTLPLRARISEVQGRNKFAGIGVCDGKLVLQSNSGKLMWLRTDQRQPQLAAPIVLSEVNHQLEISRFERVDSPPGTCYSLSRAVFPDGSEAWLDSRFMLHLKASGAAQVTLVLKEGALSGWCEEGGFFGQKYFALDGEPNEDYRAAVAAIVAFVGAVACVSS